LFKEIWRDRRLLSKIEPTERLRKELHVLDRKEIFRGENSKRRQVSFASFRRRDR
jgi:hypothetical protein